MLTVSDVWDDARDIFGHGNEKRLFKWITDGVELLANKGEIDPLVAVVDLCVDSNRCVSLPREIETLLAVNIGGHPSLGRDELFSFHLNGPGDSWKPSNYEWLSRGTFPTYRDLDCPAKLVAFLDSPEDNGKILRVFGFDEQGRPLRTQVGSTWEDGYRVPMIYGYALPDSRAPWVGRITSIQKDVTVANVRLASFDSSTTSGTLLGVFEHDETTPSYRRIKLSHACSHVRIVYRKRTLELRTVRDRIYLHSRLALLLALHAVKKYHEQLIPEALGFEAQATRILTERESVLTPPTANPIQVDDRTGLKLSPRDDIC